MKESGQSSQPAVFLDRDGVITRQMIERGPRETACVVDDVELLPRVQESLTALKVAGARLFVITNQPNVAKGKSTWDDAHAIDRRIDELLGESAALDGTYICRHHPDPEQVVVPELLVECQCRKPQPGLIQQAMKDHTIDLRNSWLIGDAETDIQAGQSVGIPDAQLLYIGERYTPTIRVVKDLWEASQYILTVIS